MKLSKLLFPIISIGFLLLLMLPAISVEVTAPEPCEIVKQTRWNPDKQRKEHLWRIEGNWYLVKETPNGDKEIVGLYSRFK